MSDDMPNVTAADVLELVSNVWTDATHLPESRTQRELCGYLEQASLAAEELVTDGGELLTETTQSESSAADVGACVPCGGTGKVVRGLPCPNCGATGRCGHSMRQPNGFCECGHADKSGSSK